MLLRVALLASAYVAVTLAGLASGHDEEPRALHWETVGELTRPRAYARAVALATGEILVVGGLDADDPEVTLYRSELVDPDDGSAVRLPQPLLGRVNHTVTAAWGDRIVVIGGTDFRRDHWAPVDRVEVFIPDSRTWLIGAPLREPRSDHGATALRDGRVLVTGGNQGARLLRTTEIYDPSTNTWTIAAPMPRPRTQFSIATLIDGRVLVAGGFRDDGRITRETLIYDPARDRWTAGPDTIEPRLNHAMVKLPGGDLLFIAGEASASDNAERFDARRREFVPAGRLRSARVVPQAAALEDGRVVLAGGLPFPATVRTFSPVEIVEIWDPRTSTWSTTISAPSARAFGALIATERGLFRVSGSEPDERSALTIERFGR
ncbi:MAG TPA: kelch repeat-containing protein [Candidatus Limnocylindria bacterium]|nr:kelch repeat-containing protein [Candidatus Limnocylindria bacterium]